MFANLYKNVFDAKIKLVSGYHGTTPIVLAMERGEVDGLAGYSWSTQPASEYRSQDRRPLVMGRLELKAPRER